MEKIKNIDLVAATLAAGVTSKIDYTKGDVDNSGKADFITDQSVKIFEEIYKRINNINNGIK